MPKPPTPALLAAIVQHLPAMRAAGVTHAEIGGVKLTLGGAQLTPEPDAANIPSTGQLSLALASAAPAAQLEALPIPDATAAQPAKPATDDAPDDLDLGHLG